MALFAYRGHSDVDTHLAVEAFQTLREHGEYLDGEYHLDGLSGSTDFDGYTVFIHDDKVDLAVYYKHRYKLDYQRDEDLELFNRKLKEVVGS